MNYDEIMYTFDLLELKYKDYKLKLLYSLDYNSDIVTFSITITQKKPLTWQISTFYKNVSSKECMLDYLTAEIEKAIHISNKAERIQQHKEHLIPKICSCCGGRISGDKCEYCGTEFMLVKE